MPLNEIHWAVLFLILGAVLTGLDFYLFGFTVWTIRLIRKLFS
jgi:hypothetical protein